jgi:hypothetical protein
MPLTIEFIRASVAAGAYGLSLHADDERLADGLTVLEVEEALASAEMLEEYPDDPRGPSCLVLGFTGGQPVHVVCGLTRQGRMLVITVYRPLPPKWKDPRTRNR